MEDSTSILFGLPGVRVREVERAGDERVVHVITNNLLRKARSVAA